MSIEERRAGARGRRRWTAVATALCLFAALDCLTAAGHAGASARFVLEKCDWELPGGSVEGASFHGAPPFTGAQNCAEDGGSIFVVQDGEAGRSAGYWSLPLPPPPGGYTESVTVTGSMCAGYMNDAGTLAYAVRGGWAPDCATQTHTFSVNSPSGDPGLIYLGCEGTCAGAPEAWAGGLAATEVDPVAPRVQSIGGSLLAGGPVRGHQTIDAVASDEGGGVAGLDLRVDGQPTDLGREERCATWRVDNPSYAGIVVTSPTPCPPVAEAAWTLDTAAPPFQEGPNQVSVCAEDFSTIGPANEACLTRSVLVENSCGESAVTGGESLSAAFRATHEQTETVGYGTSARVSGRLTSASGTPVVGASICIATAVAGAGFLAAPATSTDDEGRFTYTVPPGPDREIRLGYRHDSFQIERTLRLDTRARPTLGAAPRRLRNGARVAMRGRLPGPRAGGRVVVLQANVVGSRRWITFRRATTDAHGRFSSGYRFHSTTRRTAYRFRAVVPRQDHYPYVEGRSPAVRVTVRG